VAFRAMQCCASELLQTAAYLEESNMGIMHIHVNFSPMFVFANCSEFQLTAIEIVLDHRSYDVR